jgi:hypothetical protein
MGFFSFLKYTVIIFAAHLATSYGSPFENHCSKYFFYPKSHMYEPHFSMQGLRFS